MPAGLLTETAVLLSSSESLHVDCYGFIVSEDEARRRAARARRTPAQEVVHQRHLRKWRKMLAGGAGLCSACCGGGQGAQHTACCKGCGWESPATRQRRCTVAGCSVWGAGIRLPCGCTLTSARLLATLSMHPAPWYPSPCLPPGGLAGWQECVGRQLHTVKRRIRKGIPNEYRGLAWQFLSGGRALLAAHPGDYERLLRCTTDKVGEQGCIDPSYKGHDCVSRGGCPLCCTSKALGSADGRRRLFGVTKHTAHQVNLHKLPLTAACPSSPSPLPPASPQ